MDPNVTNVRVDTRKTLPDPARHVIVINEEPMGLLAVNPSNAAARRISRDCDVIAVMMDTTAFLPVENANAIGTDRSTKTVIPVGNVLAKLDTQERNVINARTLTSRQSQENAVSDLFLKMTLQLHI